MRRDPEVCAALYALRVMLDSAREQIPSGGVVRLTLGWNQAVMLAERLDWACGELGLYGPPVTVTEETALSVAPREGTPWERR